MAAVLGFGQDKKSFSLGILAEANANTRHGYGLAGGLQGEFSFTDHIAAGLKVDYGSDFYDVTSGEALAYGRWYFRTAFPIFVQAGAGGVMLMEGEKRVFSVLGDGALGVRFPMERFYTESYVRFGWPTGFGFGLVAGIRFGYRKAPPPVVQTVVVMAAPEPDDEEEEDDIPEGLEVLFFGYSTNFEILGPRGVELLTDNITVLNTVAYFLRDNPRYRVIVIGHANPVEGTQEEEWTRLIPLSQRRAEFVKGELLKLGVPNNRMLTYGAGGTESTSSPTSNRSVTFRFEKF